MLPVWQKTVKPFVEAGELVALGVVQEQHPDRARLYKQWRQLGWPILVDSLNLLDLAVVPVPLAIDESGIVRLTRPRPTSFEKDFLRQSYPKIEFPKEFNRAQRPNANQVRQTVSESGSAEAYRTLGDAEFCDNTPDSLGRAIEAYRVAVKKDAHDGRAHFRLGVALRRRADSTHRRLGDAQAAVKHWGEALAINPNQYIWRRRIQQYGPRLDKPYDFYSWVSQARDEIKARGELPVVLAAEPTGSEIIAPPRRGRGRRGRAEPLPHPDVHRDGSVAAMHDSDPQGKITRDLKKMVEIETVATPARVQPGQRVRVRTLLRLDERSRPYWNNEAGDGVALWVDLSKGFELGEGQLTYSNPAAAESQEMRVLEFELVVGDNLPAGEVELPAYALYYVCDDKGGKCLYLRQDFTIKFEIDPKAPKIQ